jgi:hypothetical protein
MYTQEFYIVYIYVINYINMCVRFFRIIYFSVGCFKRCLFYIEIYRKSEEDGFPHLWGGQLLARHGFNRRRCFY